MITNGERLSCLKGEGSGLCEPAESSSPHRHTHTHTHTHTHMFVFPGVFIRKRFLFKQDFSSEETGKSEYMKLGH
jgi:hypothetical protein